MQFPTQRSNPFAHPLVFSLSAGTLGLLLNQFRVPVLGDTVLTFGSTGALLAACWFGPVWGALAGAIAALQPWVAGGAAFEFFLHIAEGAFIGTCVARRRLACLPAAALFWLLIGTPVAGLMHFWLQPTPFPLNWAGAIVPVINGLLAAGLVMPLLASEHVRRGVGLPPCDDANTPLLHVFFRRFGVLTALPIAVIAMIAGRSFDATLRQQARDKLSQENEQLGLLLQNYVLEHQRDLNALAKNLSGPLPPPEVIDQSLATVREQYPGFRTLIVADLSGQIVASATPRPAEASTPAPADNFSVADRDYFQAVLRTGQPYISGVFRGRGFGQDLIVALSAPVQDATGQLSAVVEGSLNLTTILQMLEQDHRTQQREILVIDASAKVIASYGRLGIAPLTDIFSLPVGHVLLGAAPLASVDLPRAGGPRTERHLAAHAHLARIGWRIITLEPLWNTQGTIVRFYVVTALWAAIALVVAMALARVTAADITAPLAHLAEQTAALAQKRPTPPRPAPLTVSREITRISTDLQATALTLSRANTDLQGAMQERDHSNQMLRQVLLHLDDKVRERTAQLDEARVAAESANRAKSEFLASMSHELRTPLNVILGMAEIVREQTLGPLNPRQKECIECVEESGRHLLALINDILDLSKIEAGMFTLDFGEVTVREIGEATFRLIRSAAAKKRLQLVADYRHTTETIRADPRRLKQILLNLLSNAIKFTPEAGTITLRVEQTATPPRLLFHVQDTGIGIAPEHIGRLFQPFQQIDTSLNRQYAGSGLGLALVRRMTELHGGTVQVTSEAGAGSCFTVSLPLGPEPAPRPLAETPRLTRRDTLPPLPGHPHILVAEDNETNIALYTQASAFAHCRFTIARNGREAVALARAELPDIIFMDVQMPEVDGLEATRQLRADPATAHIPIITLTALARPEDRLRCLEAGASAYLSKPVHLADLARQSIELLQAKPSPPSAS